MRLLQLFLTDIHVKYSLPFAVAEQNVLVIARFISRYRLPYISFSGMYEQPYSTYVMWRLKPYFLLYYRHALLQVDFEDAIMFSVLFYFSSEYKKNKGKKKKDTDQYKESS